jgi:hypothetical protein
MTTVTVTLGSISTGTLRTEDLLEAFAAELQRLDPASDLPEDVEKLRFASHDMEDSDDGFGEHCLSCGDYENELDLLCAEASERINEQASYMVNEQLFDALNACAPPFVYFGAHPGDGADFGFWPDVDALEEEIRYAGEDTADADTKYLPASGLFVEVSDHGNIRVMDMERRELWSCV